MKIRVGLITEGEAVLEPIGGGLTRVCNLLIGKDFHWQQRLSIVVEGDLIRIAPTAEGISVINELPLERYVASVIGSEMNAAAPREFLKAHAVISRSWAARKVNEGRSTSLKNFVFARNSSLRSLTPIPTLQASTEGERIISWQGTESHEGFDVCSDDHCQRYQGALARAMKNEKLKIKNGHAAGVGYSDGEEYLDKTLLGRADEIVKETEGLVLVDREGEIADTRFSKCCGGMTELFSTCWEDTDPHYLVSKPDPWCDLSGMSDAERETFMQTAFKDYDRGTDFYHWESETDAEAVGTRLRERFGCDLGEIRELTPKERGGSGRIKLLEIEGSKGKILLGKELSIRRLLSDTHLYSSAFDIVRDGKRFKITGRGWGHGVGLCQIGAANMARAGHTFEEILEFYYPGTRLKKIED
jgi:SpoIID/LytB domain protein